MEFHIPVRFEDLEVAPPQDGQYQVQAVQPVRDLPETAGANQLFDAEEALAVRGADLVQPRHFDRLYSFVGAFADLPPRQAAALIGALTKGLSQLLGAVAAGGVDVRDDGEARAEHRNALKMYVFLLAAVVAAGERAAHDAAIVAKGGPKKKKKGGGKNGAGAGGWRAQKEELAGALVHAAESAAACGLWSAGAPEEAYGNLFFKTAALMLEQQDNVRDAALRAAVFKLFAAPVRRFQFEARATAAVVHLLHNFEHLPPHVAELMRVCAEDYGCDSFVADVIRDVGRTDTRLLGKDAAAARNLSGFMSELATRVPRLVLRHVSLLVGHLGSENYAMRNGVVLVLGRLVEHLSGVQRDAEKSPSDESEAAAADARKRAAQLYDILEERALDTTSYVRSKVLQTWSQLVEGGCVAKATLPTVVAIAVGRLQDKSSQVRKYAIQLMTNLLQYNPFAGSLAGDEFRAKLHELGTDFKACMEDLQRKKDEAKGADSEEDEEEEEEEEEEEDDGKDKETDDSSPGARSAATHAMTPEEDAELKAKKQQLDWCFGALRFIAAVEEATPTLCKLFSSKSTTDVLECVTFFVTATQFRLEAARTGVRKMLVLVWSKEESVRKTVIDAYTKLYVGAGAARGGAQSVAVARRLVSLTADATLGDMTSLEELLAQMTFKRLVPRPVVRALWDIVSGAVPGVSPAERSGAMAVVSMMAGARPDMVTGRVGTVVEVGFGPAADECPLLCRHACVALQRLVRGRTVPRGGTTAGLAASLVKAAELDAVFEALAGVFARVTPDRASLDAWFPAAEQAVSAVFLLHPDPERVFGGVLRRMSDDVFGGADAADRSGSCGEGGEAWALARLFFVLGHVGIKLLVSLEQAEARLKHARQEASKADERRKEESRGDGDDDRARSKIEDELAVGASQDYQIEVVREDAERGLLFGRNMLAAYAPLVVRVCQHPDAFPDATLRASASLALCKLMCLGSDFCEANLPLLFTLLERDDDPNTRANVVIALGDMAFRFPNEIEPWSGKIYLRLRDRDSGVRRNTMMVLTHLILNDMIKVKGPISEMAKSLLDEDERIADMARVFFNELAQKGKNPIYNILPDAISRLSGDPAVSPEAFRTIMSLLVAFVEKDRQLEMLVDKLSARFADRTDLQHWRDLAFCLSQLGFVEKAVKRLRDNFRHYKDALYDDEVWACFSSLLAKGKKFARPETKKQLEELEQMLGECHSAKSEDHKVSTKAAKKARRARKKGGSSGGGGGSGDDDDDDYVARELSKAVQSAAEVAATQRRTGVRMTTKSGKRIGGGRAPSTADDVDAENSGGNNRRRGAAAAPAKRPPRRRRPRARVVESSSSEEEEEESSSSSEESEIEELQVSDDE